MKLFELAFACFVFSAFESAYQKAYEDFLKENKPHFDMRNEKHQVSLLRWLNKWRCRQFEPNSHAKISEKLREWFKKYGALPSEQKKLIDLSSKEVTDAAKIYYTLEKVRIPCSKGEKRVGPTGASKILFAMRKDIYPIWDDAMRKVYRSEGCSTYEGYMKCVQRELSELKDACKNNKIEIDELPDKLNRKNEESLLKLLDEYHYWTVKTRKVTLPSLLKNYKEKMVSMGFYK